MERLNVIKMEVLPTLIYRVLQSLSNSFFFKVEVHKQILHFMGKCKGHKITRVILKKKKNGVGRLTSPYIRKYW